MRESKRQDGVDRKDEVEDTEGVCAALHQRVQWGLLLPGEQCGTFQGFHSARFPF